MNAHAARAICPSNGLSGLQFWIQARSLGISVAVVSIASSGSPLEKISGDVLAEACAKGFAFNQLKRPSAILLPVSPQEQRRVRDASRKTRARNHIYD